jgi:hypothetical protein
MPFTERLIIVMNDKRRSLGGEAEARGEEEEAAKQTIVVELL